MPRPWVIFGSASDPSNLITSRPSHYKLNVTPPTIIQHYRSPNQTASIIPELISNKCNHRLRGPPTVPTRSKAQTPVGVPLRTALPLPTHPFSTASNPPRSTAAQPAPHALLEEPMSFSTTQKTKRNATDSGRARGVSRMTRPSSERRRRSS